MSIGGACKAVTMPLVAVVEKFENHGEHEEHEGFDDTPAPASSTTVLTYILSIAMWIGAGYLAWNCNSSQSLIMRLIYTSLAMFFNMFYLIYYLIYRVLMGNSC